MGFLGLAGAGAGLRTRFLEISPAMARIKLVERGSLNGPLTIKAATARLPSGN